MTRTRMSLAGAALVAAAVPACVQLPSPAHDAVTRAAADKAVATPVASQAPPASPETTVSRRPQQPRLQYIDLRSVKVSPADPPPEVTPVKAEQPPAAAPGKLDLPTIDGIPLVESPTNPTPQASSPILTALQYYQAESPERATRALDQMGPANRDLLKALLPLAARLGSADAKPASADDVAATLAQLEAAAAVLRPNAALRIARLCYCRPVQAPTRFGVYQPLEGRHAFRPGEVVAVYVEMRNFTSELKGDTYQTHLRSMVEILNAAGRVEHQFDFNADDASLSPRQDYCHVGRFLLPKLPAGDYTLRLTVTDRPTKREAQKSLDLRVGAADPAGN